MSTLADECLYRATVRVPTSDWETHGDWLFALPGFGDFDPLPPCAGPEVELQFDCAGLSEVAAETRARQRLEEHGITVLAIRVRERAPA